MAALIRVALNRNGEKTAVVHKDNSLTYKELARQVDQAVLFLQSIGLQPNKRIAVYLPDSVQSIALRLASHLIGIEIVLIPTSFSLNTLNQIIDQTKPQLVIIPEESDIYLNAKTLFFQPSPQTGAFASVSLPAPHNPATINFSSGSTGMPKGIKLDQSSWAASCHAFVKAANIEHEHQQTYLPLIPLTVAGSTSLLPALLAGMRIIIPANRDINEVATLIEAYKVNFIFLTPIDLIKLMNHCHTSATDLASLNKIAVGTDTVHAALLQRAIEMFGPILSCGYGMAEVLPPLTLLGPDDYRGLGKNNPVWRSVGKPYPHVRISILDEQGKKLPNGKTGIICLHSPSRAQGYIDATEKDRCRFQKDGTFISEDFGYLDNRGYLYVKGRVNQKFETCAGQRFAGDIEELCLQNSRVDYACAVKDKETIYILVVSFNGDISGVQDTLLTALNNAIPNTDFKIKIVEEMPQTAAGKADRQAVLERFDKAGE
jgi:acyl-CoA synthetase (AMP-forming)/AMP-acid ligase II